MGEEDGVIRFSDCTVEIHTGRIRGGRGGALTERELALVAYLAGRPNQAVSRDELMEAVWGRSELSLSRAVDTAMRRLRTKIEADPKSPRHLITVFGTGYLFVPAEAAEPGGGDTNLRPPEGVFVGRGAVGEAVAAQWDAGARLVSLVGPPGIGKTRFSVQYGLDMVESMPGGVWLVDLAAVRSLEQILSGVAAVLGVPLSSRRDSSQRATTLGHAIDGRGPAMFVFDNFEQVAEFGAQTVGCWLEAAPKARFLVTSREPLGIDGEVVLPLDVLSRDEAVDLFVERARVVRPGYAPNAPERRVLAEICEELDRLPLAIELAAARMGVLTAAQLQDRLSKRFRLLGRSVRGGPSRQATLRAAIDWSWDLLDEGERKVLRECAVFAGGFDAAAADAVLSDIDALRTLVSRSLVRRYGLAAVPGEMRYGLLESIRVYAAEKSASEPDAARATEDRHGAHYAQCGQEWSIAILEHGGIERLDRLQIELENLTVAHGRDLLRNPDRAALLALAADAVLHIRGPFDRLTDMLDDSLLILKNDKSNLRYRLLGARAKTRRRRGALDGAVLDYRDAISLCREAGDVEREAIYTGNLGNLYIETGEVARAEPYIRDSLTRLRSLGDRHGEGVVLCDLGVVCKQLGRAVEAEEHYRAGREILAEIGDRLHLGVVLGNLAINRAETGDLGESRSLFMEALEIHRAVGNRRPEGLTLTNLGQLAVQMGDLDGGRDFLLAAIKVHREIGNRRFQAIALGNLGVVWLRMGDTDAAERDLLAAIELQGNQRDLASLKADLGGVRWSQGRLEDAHALMDEGIALHATSGNAFMHGYHLAFRGALEAVMGDHLAAKASLDEAEERFDGQGDNLVAVLRACAEAEHENADITALELVFETIFLRPPQPGVNRALEILRGALDRRRA